MAVFDLRNTAVVLLYHLNLSSLSTSLTVISISKFRPLNGPHTGRRQRSREKPSTPNAPPPGRWPPAFPRPAPRPRVRRLAWLLGCCLRLSRRPLLASLSPRADRPGVPCLRRSAAARPGKPLKNRPACALQLCTVWRGRPLARAGSACVHVCSCPGNAIFEHVFRSCGCHRAAAGLGRSSKACTACAL